MRPLIYATQEFLPGIFSLPSGYSWVRLRGRHSSSAEVNKPGKSNDAQKISESNKATPVDTPGAGISLVATMVHGAHSSKRPWMDAEQGRGIIVKTEMNQSATSREYVND